MANLAWINSLSSSDAAGAFLRCCGSVRWAQAMAGRRPFTSDAELYDAAEAVWSKLTRADWLEAFAAHPRIGDLDSLRKKFVTTADWAAAEQSGVSGAAEAVLLALAEGNRRYEEQFGYLFIVCATGKTASQMHDILERRLGNKPDQELKEAAGEQAKITRLRLEKL